MNEFLYDGSEQSLEGLIRWFNDHKIEVDSIVTNRTYITSKGVSSLLKNLTKVGLTRYNEIHKKWESFSFYLRKHHVIFVENVSAYGSPTIRDMGNAEYELYKQGKTSSEFTTLKIPIERDKGIVEYEAEGKDTH